MGEREGVKRREEKCKMKSKDKQKGKKKRKENGARKRSYLTIRGAHFLHI